MKAADDQTLRMTCMEVWGGCEPVNAAVTLPGLDAWVYSRPFGDDHSGANPAGGGDVYYVSSCATGRINRLLVADVAGHGARVRDLAVSLRDMMRRYVNYIDQSRFVLSMNRQFAEDAAAGSFATAVVTTFFAPTRTLSVCNAGHPPPLVWRAGAGEWTLLHDSNGGGDASRAGNLPLGIEQLADLCQFHIDLDVGDMVLIYTDSLIEARNAAGEMLGISGLLSAVRGMQPADRANLIPGILEAVGRHTGAVPDADDVTMMLLFANGSASRAALKDLLLTPLRLAKGVGRWALGRGPAGLPQPTIANLGGALIPALNRRWSKQKTHVSS